MTLPVRKWNEIVCVYSPCANFMNVPLGWYFFCVHRVECEKGFYSADSALISGIPASCYLTSMLNKVTQAELCY